MSHNLYCKLEKDRAHFTLPVQNCRGTVNSGWGDLEAMRMLCLSRTAVERMWNK